MKGHSSPANKADRNSRHLISDTQKMVFSQKHRRVAAASAKKQQSSDADAQHTPLRDPHRRVTKHDSSLAAAIRRSLLAISVDMDADSSAVHVGADVDIAGVELGVDLDLGASSTSSSPPTSSAPPSTSSTPPSTSSTPPSSTFSVPPSSTSSPLTSSSPPSSSAASTSQSASASASTSVSASQSASTSVSASASQSASTSVSASQSASASSASQSASQSSSASQSASRSAPPSSSFVSSPPSSSAQPPPSSSSSSPSSSRSSSFLQSSAPASSFSSLSASASSLSASASSLPASTSSPISTSMTGGHNIASGSLTFSTTATSGASATHTGSLNSGGGNADSFARNVGGIVGVAIGGVIALIVGVLVVFFLCGRFRPRFRAAAARVQGSPGPNEMRQRGGWTSPLAGDDESVQGYGATGAWQGAAMVGSSEGHASGEGSGEGSSDARASSEVHHIPGSSSGHGHTTLAFAEAGETLAAGAVLGTASSLGHGQATSSQGHSNSSNSHMNTNSSSSHAQMSSPTSSSPQHASSSSDHWNTSASASAHTHARTSPPSSYAQHQPQPQTPASQQEGRASPKPPFLWRLRGGQPSSASGSTSVPTPPTFDPSTLQAPTRSGRPPSSLLNPPPAWGEAFAQTAAGGAGWRPPPLISPALSTGSNASDDAGVVPTEGLLRPGLAVLQSHSTNSLWDHVDYSRPIAGAGEGRTNLRMESAATFVTMTTGSEADREDGHSQTGEVGEWPAPTPLPG